MALRIDLNADLGEGFGAWTMGDDAAMLGVVTSASVACGGHAGDPDTMVRTLTLARDRGVTVGAHPGFADPAGFGRRVIPMTPDAIGRLVAVQTGALLGAAALAGVRIAYVKPHGALANLAAADPAVAQAIAQAVRAVSPDLGLLCLSGTALARAGEAAGLRVVQELYADRAYLPDGQLVPRDRPGAVLHDTEAIADRMLRWVDTGRMPLPEGGDVALHGQSICVHGDTPGAVAIARHLRAALEAAGVTVAAVLP